MHVDHEAALLTLARYPTQAAGRGPADLLELDLAPANLHTLPCFTGLRSPPLTKLFSLDHHSAPNLHLHPDICLLAYNVLSLASHLPDSSQHFYSMVCLGYDCSPIQCMLLSYCCIWPPTQARLVFFSEQALPDTRQHGPLVLNAWRAIRHSFQPS